MKTIKRLLVIFSVCSLIVACDKYDDTELRNKIDNIESRVEALESLCSRLNSDIASMRLVLEALENKDYVTNVTPVVEAGKTIGYTIQFSKSGAVTIYNGKDGADGKDGQNGTDGKDGQDGKDGENGHDGITPIIGVRQDTDGIWYWTINGEWLLNNGEKVKAVGTDGENGKDGSDGKDGQDGTDGKDGQDGKDGENGNDGTDGQDGITPLLRIENDYWQISYDNGLTWQTLGKAKGEDGVDGKDGADGKDGVNGQDGRDGLDGDSLFSSVTEDDDYVYLNLAAGNTIKIPKGTASKFALNIDKDELDVMTGSATIEIGYTIDCATDKTVVRAYGQNGWFASVRPADKSSGKIVIVAPEVLVAGEILILACDGETTLMAIIDCVQGSISLADNAVQASYTGGTFTIPVKTNIEYTVEIPEEAASWITNVETKAMRDETIFITVAENPNITARHSVLNVKDSEGNVLQTIAVNQDGKAVEGALEITVNTIGTLADVLAEYDYANVKSLKINGVLNDEDFLTIYYEMPALRYLDLSTLTISALPDKSFYKSTNVESVILPEGLTQIGASAFSESKIKEIAIGPNVQTIEGSAFASCGGLISLELPDALTSIGESAFSACTSLTAINIPANVNTIGVSAFFGCTALSSITFSSGSNLSALNDNVFQSCPITKILIPASVATISTTAFAGCVALTDVDFEDGCLLSIMDRYFADCPIAKVKIPANVTKITYNAFDRLTSLTEVIFEKGSKCKEIEGKYQSGNSINNNSSLYSSYGAFYLTSIKSIEIPASVEIIGPNAFRDTKLESVLFEENSNLTTLTSNGIGNRSMFYSRSSYGAFENKYLYPEGAFSGCIFKSIVMPKSLKYIGPETFSCSSLQNITFEEGSQLSDICALAFACSDLESIEIPANVTFIGGAAFSCCTSLVSISFQSTSKLSSILYDITRYNNNTKDYELGTFYSCTALTSITLPASLTEIAQYSFYGCTALKTIKFSENSTLATIGDYGFYDCPVLHTVDMSNCNQVTKIGASAFNSSDEMRLFKIGTVVPPTCGSTPFGAVGNYSVLKVPDGAVTQYQSASGWKDFASITGLNE